MSKADGAVIGTTLIAGAAPRNRAFNIVLLAEGFTAAQQDDFNNACTAFVNAFRTTPPFDELSAAINVFRVNVRSTDAGADDPAAAGGTGATANTYFDATFGSNNTRRLLVCDTKTALEIAGAQVPEFTVVLVVVNSTIYGGSGGSVSTYSLAGGATEIAIHEMGHTAFGLTDEYAYYAGGNEPGHDHHPADEPNEPNVTTKTGPTRETIKWGWAIAAPTAIPTMANPNPTCSTVDERPSPVPAGTVGLFEGAHYYHCGAYRPEYDCKMRTLGQPFCTVCEEQIITVLEKSGGIMTWKTKGNSGTNSTTNFLGTTDKQPLVIKVNMLEALSIDGFSLLVRGADFRLVGRGGGAGNNGGIGRALVDGGLGDGLIVNYANDFGKVQIPSDLFIGGNLIMRGADFRLVGRGGGAGNNGGIGRALVDGGPGGGLIVNYGNDFGRVQIPSDLSIDGILNIGRDLLVRGADFQLVGRGGGAGNNGGIGRALVDGGPGGGLIVNYGNDFGRVQIPSDLQVTGNVEIGSASKRTKLHVVSAPKEDESLVWLEASTSRFPTLVSHNLGNAAAFAGFANTGFAAGGAQNDGAGAGLAGVSVQETKTSIGVIGQAGGNQPISFNENGGVGVVGQSINGDGILGSTLSAKFHAVEAGNYNTQGVGAALHGFTVSPNGTALYAENAAGGYAGSFLGNVVVSGRIVAGAKSFRIDHPLDPANKYLNHSAVESPDMMTVYNGNAAINESCEAEIGLPSYFQALNRDFRYQLTVIGTFAHAIVAHEVENNRFTIRTDKPNVKVSWQVTGIRKDPFAEANRVPVEEDKVDHERGRYLHPKSFEAQAAFAVPSFIQPINHLPGMFTGLKNETTSAKSILGSGISLGKNFVKSSTLGDTSPQTNEV